MKNINAENMAESLRIQREETQRAQRLTTETQFIGAHALNRQADVLQSAAENLGQMSSMGGGNGGGMNPAGMMAGIGIGGAVGGQMAGMMNQMGQAMSGQMNGVPPTGGTQQQVPPPPAQPAAPTWMLAINGQQSGPYSVPQLQQLVQTGHLTPQTHVWKPGMANWAVASSIPELTVLFMPPTSSGVPPVPPVPPTN